MRSSTTEGTCGEWHNCSLHVLGRSQGPTEDSLGSFDSRDRAQDRKEAAYRRKIQDKRSAANNGSRPDHSAKLRFIGSNYRCTQSKREFGSSRNKEQERSEIEEPVTCQTENKRLFALNTVAVSSPAENSVSSNFLCMDLP